MKKIKNIRKISLLLIYLSTFILFVSFILVVYISVSNDNVNLDLYLIIFFSLFPIGVILALTYTRWFRRYNLIFELYILNNLSLREELLNNKWREQVLTWDDKLSYDFNNNVEEFIEDLMKII